MLSNIFEEYATLEAEIKAREEKKEQLRPFIIEKMLKESSKKVETSVGSFSINQLKKWEYPQEVLKIGEDFKAAKAKAESTGEATYKEQPSLRFTIIKL